MKVPAETGVDRRRLVGEALPQACCVEPERHRVERRRMRPVEVEMRPARVVEEDRVAQGQGYLIAACSRTPWARVREPPARSRGGVRAAPADKR